jgi:DNA-binding MarR family transcriptional regulator
MHGLAQSFADDLVAFVGLMNDPGRDRLLLAEARLDLDPLLLPLLVRIGVWGAAGAVELSQHLGRDHSTVSRQLAKLEGAGLVERAALDRDRRVRQARLTPRGREGFEALAAARIRLLDGAMSNWPPSDRAALAELFHRFVQAVGRKTT